MQTESQTVCQWCFAALPFCIRFCCSNQLSGKNAAGNKPVWLPCVLVRSLHALLLWSLFSEVKLCRRC